MRKIKVKATGVETMVSEEYFKTYESQGWFIELVSFPEPEMIVLPKPKAPKKGE